MVTSCLGVLLTVLAQTSDTAKAVRADSLTAPSLTQRLAELAPIVERYAGRNFDSVPQIRVVDAQGMIELLTEDVGYVDQLRGTNAGKGLKKDVENMLDEELKFYSDVVNAALNLVGKYGLKRDEIALSPTALEALAKQRGLSDGERNALVDLVLAHELVHALCDQRIGYAKLIGEVYRGEAHGRMFPFLNEGLAVQITRGVAGDLGHASALTKLEEIINGSHMGDVYERGTGVMKKILDRYGVDAMWAMLEDPARLEPLEPDTEAIGNKFKQALAGPAVRRLMPCDTPEYAEAPPQMGMQAFRLMDGDRQRAVLEVLEKVHNLACVPQDHDPYRKIASVTVYVTKDDASARKIGAAVVESFGTLEALLRSRLDVRVTDNQREFAELTCSEKSLQLAYQGQSVGEHYMISCPVGPAVVHVLTANATPPMEDVHAAFKELRGILEK